jgi:hypothetical protein
MVTHAVQALLHYKAKNAKDTLALKHALQIYAMKGASNGEIYNCICWDMKLSISFLSAFAKLRKVTISFEVSVRQHGATRLSLDGFSWSFMFEAFFSKKIMQFSLKSDKNNE